MAVMTRQCDPGGQPSVTSQHQVQVLHGGTGSAFTEIVEYRRQQDVAILLVAEYAQLHVIAAVERLWIKLGDAHRLLLRYHTDMYARGVVLFQRGLYLLNRYAGA